MPSPIASQAASTFVHIVDGPVTDAVTEATPFIAALKKKGNIHKNVGGTSLRTPGIQYRDHTISNWTGGRTIIGGYEPDLFTYAEHNWVGYQNLYFDNEYDNLENKGKSKLFDLEKENAKALVNRWVTHFEEVLFVNGLTATPVALGGLPAFMKATGTYGTLAQTEAYWAPTVINGTTALTPRTFKSDPKAYLTRARNSVALRKKSAGIAIMGGPDFAITTQTIWEHLKSYYEGLGQLVMSTTTSKVGLNVESIHAEGMDIHWSPEATSGVLYGLSMDDIHLYLQTADWFGKRTLPVLEPISNAYQSWWKGQLASHDQRGHFIINTISV